MPKKTPILETKRHYTERSLSRVFLSVLGTKTLKLWKSLYMGIKSNITKNVSFELLTYQNAKTYGKHTLLRNKITLP